MKHRSRHAERVVATASDPSAAARSRLAASWRRSLDHHGLDPAQRDDVHRITESELVERRAMAEEIRRIATPKLDILYQLVGASGCGVLLTDSDGVVLDVRVSDADRVVFDAWASPWAPIGPRRPRAPMASAPASRNRAGSSSTAMSISTPRTSA